jgi:GNAT superfamily N-acetyltransferase
MKGQVFIEKGHSADELAEMNRAADEDVKNKEQFAAIMKTLTDLAIETMGTAPYYFLSLLFTHPDHYRRGVGRLLTRWGTEKADENGLDCYIESSVEGKPLYVREGFVERREIAFSMKEYGDEEDDVLCFMVRPVKG